MTSPTEYAQAHNEAFINELIDLIRIPSISTRPEHASDMRHAAEWLKDHCLSLGMTHAQIYDTDIHPIVYAEWLEAGDDKPTVLVYGHYDVQPPEPLDKWTKNDNPFEPVIIDDKLYARGASDDKGQLFIHLKVFESFMKATGTFPVNIKFLFEGEEEMSSASLFAFIDNHTELLACDVAVISDTGIPTPDMPIIVYGLRGIVYTELEVTGPVKDLHSGMYGGTVHNPAQAIAEIVASMHDAKGHITVDGFYDNVRDLTDDERQMSQHMTKIFEQEWEEQAGAPAMWGEPEFNPAERIGARPTLEINGIYGGFTERGGQKTVIPSWALAKISCRLVSDQDPDRIFNLLKAHIEKIAPPTINWELRLLSSAKPVLIDINTRPVQFAMEAFERVFGRAPIFTREGGSIPVVLSFQEKLEAPVVMLGFGLPDDNLHAPDEKFSLEMFRKGIETSIIFYDRLASL